MSGAGDVSAELRALSAWVDISLADEAHSRQAIAARAAEWARSIAGQADEPQSAAPAPLETEDDALALPAVRAVTAAGDAHEAAHGIRDVDGWRAARHAATKAIIGGAIEAAGVRTGAYDERILAWLAGWEPQTCAVIAGLITRAAAGSPAAAAPALPETEGLALARLRLAVAAWEADRDAAEAACGDGTGSYRRLSDRASAAARIAAQDAAALLAEIGAAS